MYIPTRVHTRIELQVLPQIKSDPKVDSQVLTKMTRRTKTTTMNNGYTRQTTNSCDKHKNIACTTNSV